MGIPFLLASQSFIDLYSPSFLSSTWKILANQQNDVPRNGTRCKSPKQQPVGAGTAHTMSNRRYIMYQNVMLEKQCHKPPPISPPPSMYIL